MVNELAPEDKHDGDGVIVEAVIGVDGLGDQTG